MALARELELAGLFAPKGLAAVSPRISRSTSSSSMKKTCCPLPSGIPDLLSGLQGNHVQRVPELGAIAVVVIQTDASGGDLAIGPLVHLLILHPGGEAVAHHVHADLIRRIQVRMNG